GTVAGVAVQECPAACGGSWSGAGARRRDRPYCERSLRGPGRLQEGTTRTWRCEADRDTWSSTPRFDTLRSTPLEDLDPGIRLFEGEFLGSLSEPARELRNSHRQAWLRTLAGRSRGRNQSPYSPSRRQF